MDKNFANNVRQAEWEIRNALREYGFVNNYVREMAVTYLLYQASRSIKHELNYNDVLNNVSDKEGMLIRELLPYSQGELERIWQRIRGLAFNFAPAVFAYILLQPSAVSLTESRTERPESINKLLESFLDLHKGEKVLETCSGVGDTLIFLAEKHDCVFSGMELNSQEKGISEIRTDFLDKNINVASGNFIEKQINGEVTEYDKVYSFHPLVKLAHYVSDNTIEALNAEFKSRPFKRMSLLDWTMALSAVKCLKASGIAVVFVADGSLFSNVDEAIRRELVEKGFLKAVINLPTKLFAARNVNMSMLILSRDNTFVRLVNARNICQEGRRQNTLSDENIAEIIDLYKNSGKYTIDVRKEDIQNNGYSLSPERYMTLDNIELKHPVEFSSVVEEIGRAVPLSARQLDELASEEPTDIRYVRLADIQDGFISDELPYLKSVESRYERYFLKDGDLLLSKIGAPFKTAIVKIKGAEKTLPIGNMYVIRVKESEIDTHYLKAFLESSKGVALLNAITTGTTIPIINVDSLQRMPIECPDIKKQKKIANKYQTVCDEITMLKAKLLAATDRLGNVIDEVDEEEDE